MMMMNMVIFNLIRLQNLAAAAYLTDPPNADENSSLSILPLLVTY